MTSLTILQSRIAKYDEINKLGIAKHDEIDMYTISKYDEIPKSSVPKQEEIPKSHTMYCKTIISLSLSLQNQKTS